MAFDILKKAWTNPKLLVGVGITAMVGAGVWACAQTLGLRRIIREQANKIDDITESHSEEELKLPEVKKQLNLTKAQTIGRVCLCYVGPVAVASIGIFLICRSYGLQRQAYLAVSAAYATVSKAYNTALDRVQAKYGEEGLKYVKYGIEEQEVEKEIVDEKGKTKKVKEKEDVLTGDISEMKKSRPFLIVFD